MLAIGFFPKLAVSFLICLSAVACKDDGSSHGPADAGGRPVGRGNGAQAPEGPIKVPRPNLVGNALSLARPLIESGIRNQCKDHTLCVKIELKESTSTDVGSTCYLSTTPDYALPGSTVYIITGKGSAPCAGSVPDVSGSPESPGDSEPPPGGESPPVTAPS
jgi:hypothetical protein